MYFKTTTAGLDEAQAGIKIAGRNINNLRINNLGNIRYADNTTLMAESKEELKNLLMKVKEVSEKVGLNLTFRKLRSWQIDGETMKTVKDFILQAPKSLQIVTAAMKLKDSCSLEEKL